MNSVLLSIPSKTVKEIARQLDIPVIFNKQRVTIDEDTFVIRWGSTKKLPSIPEEDILNDAEAIKIASDKPTFIELLVENEIPTVEESETQFPLIARRAKHSSGRGLWYCKSNFGLQKARSKGAVNYYRYYPKTREFRIHIAGGKVILFSEKLGNTNKIIWNHKINDFNFRHMARHEWLEDEVLMSMQKSCKDVMELIGLDFAAFDVMAYPKDKSLPTYCILEANTAPSLSPLAIEKYVAYFKKAYENWNRD